MLLTLCVGLSSMIQSFKDKETEKIWNQIYSKRIPKDVQRIGFRKLIMIHRAKDLFDLRVPPENRLEQLSGNRMGQYSIRINSQWRVCFNWNEGIVSEVEVTDYH